MVSTRMRPIMCGSYRMICLLLSVLLLLAPAAALGPRTCDAPVVITDAKFIPGQVWSFQSRPGEGASTVTILRVESLPKVGVVIHIRIDGIQFKNCTGGPSPTSIQHAPFTKAALDQSVTHLIRSVNVPQYEAGYRSWLAHCGGVYTISVAAMVDADDATFNAGLGCPSSR